MKYNQDDIDRKLKIYISKNLITDRFASFDFCYSYFHPKSKNELLNDIEKSCLAIGFYLASWGMLRGSSFLLSKSVKHYEPLIQYISKLDKTFWEIDVHCYDKNNIKTILEIYENVKDLLIKDKNSDLTLVTKVLLGVFGFVPAFHSYFIKTFGNIFRGECGFRKLNHKSLLFIKKFYEHNSAKIDAYKISVKAFSGNNTGHLFYPKCKIIDMYGFSKGNSK